MTVSSDWDDTTWQTHLDGYLSLLRQTGQQPTGKAQDSMLAQALQCAGDDATVQHFHSYGTMADIDKTTLLLDISKLRLRTLARKLCTLLHGATPPRKLDVQKLQSYVKQIYADLLLITHPVRPISTPERLVQYNTTVHQARLIDLRCGGSDLCYSGSDALDCVVPRYDRIESRLIQATSGRDSNGCAVRDVAVIRRRHYIQHWRYASCMGTKSSADSRQ
jgi:hypothetical protein